MNAELAQAAVSLLEAGKSFALATIVESEGSTPRHVGASMLVRTDGSIAGTIGGGPLEATAIQHALGALAAGKTLVMGYDSPQLGMMCGGGGIVLIEYTDSTRLKTRELYRNLLDLLRSGRRGWLVTAVSDEGAEELTTNKCLVDSGGAVFGDPVHPLESLQQLAKRGGTYDQILANGSLRTYVQPVGALGAAYVFGAGHCGEKLVPVLSTIGFFTVIVDDRADFANQERFPTADRVVVPESFDAVVETLPIDGDSYVVIVTRGHAHDKNVLRQALGTRAGYVGMIGSKKKVAGVLQALRDEGFSADDIARVHAPIGLSIGAETPEEIAVSIAAELIQVRASKREN